jgi:hypothetical protein
MTNFNAHLHCTAAFREGGSAKGVSSQMKATNRAVILTVCARLQRDASCLFILRRAN